MLRHKLIHPQITAILAAAGHHSTVLIADGNYPAASKRGPRAELISLNLMPGVPTCNQVLEAVLSAIPVEAIQTMKTETSGPYAARWRSSSLGRLSQDNQGCRHLVGTRAGRQMGLLRSGQHAGSRPDHSNCRSTALCEHLVDHWRANGLT